jgi:hypothetical protein
MGRLTLNVLLSFAQFEREVTSERIRDKIAASNPRLMAPAHGGGLAHLADGAADRTLKWKIKRRGIDRGQRRSATRRARPAVPGPLGGLVHQKAAGISSFPEFLEWSQAHGPSLPRAGQNSEGHFGRIQESIPKNRDQKIALPKLEGGSGASKNPGAKNLPEKIPRKSRNLPSGVCNIGAATWGQRGTSLTRQGDAVGEHMRLAQDHPVGQVVDDRRWDEGLPLEVTPVRAIRTPSPCERKRGSPSSRSAKRPLGF